MSLVIEVFDWRLLDAKLLMILRTLRSSEYFQVLSILKHFKVLGDFKFWAPSAHWMNPKNPKIVGWTHRIHGVQQLVHIESSIESLLLNLFKHIDL